MQWEAERTPGLPGPGWHSDPFDPAGRLRWWDGTAWTARVALLAADAGAISWRADLAEQSEPTGDPGALPAATAEATVPAVPSPSPAMWAPQTEPIPAPISAEPPVERAAPSPSGFRLEPFTLSEDLETSLFVPADDEVEEEDADRVVPTARKKAAMLAAAVLVLLGIGAGVGTAMLGDDQRPTVDPRVAYQDADADFSFRYPERWRIEEQGEACGSLPETVECTGVLFEIGPDVSAGDANTLRVRTLDTDARLGELHEWVATQTQGIIDAGAGRHLVSAETTDLAGAPAFRLEFVDSTASPPTRVIAYEGRTTTGRALTVSITIRDPRTAPTEDEIDKFLASVTSS